MNKIAIIALDTGVYAVTKYGLYSVKQDLFKSLRMSDIVVFTLSDALFEYMVGHMFSDAMPWYLSGARKAVLISVIMILYHLITGKASRILGDIVAVGGSQAIVKGIEYIPRYA